jgi:hypothetical protein
VNEEAVAHWGGGWGLSRRKQTNKYKQVVKSVKTLQAVHVKLNPGFSLKEGGLKKRKFFLNRKFDSNLRKDLRKYDNTEI